MERDQHQDRPGAVRPRERGRGPDEVEDDERITLEDVDAPPAENPALDDV